MKKFFTTFILILSVFMLAACQPGGDEDFDVEPDSQSSDSNDSSGESVKPSNNTLPPSQQSQENPSLDSSHPNNDEEHASPDNMTNLVKQIEEKARDGRILLEDKIAIHDSSQMVLDEYGEPDTSSNPNVLDYMNSLNVEFYLDGDRVVEIQSTNPTFERITLDHIQEALGSTTSSGSEPGKGEAYTYPVGPYYLHFFVENSQVKAIKVSTFDKAS